MEVVVTVALNTPTFAADEFEYAGIKPIAEKARVSPAGLRSPFRCETRLT
jgi:hypothetical protein